MQAANAKLLDALRSRMLDVGASRSAHRLPSLQHANGEGSSAASAAILQSISSQLEVSPRILAHLSTSISSSSSSFYQKERDVLQVMGSSSLNREIHA